MSFIKKIDRYIIKKFVSTYLFTMGIFIMIGILVDLSEKVNYFVEEQLSVGYIAQEYYLNFIIWMMVFLTPLFILLAVIYFTSRLSDQSEIIALRNAGMSFGQLFKPYLITACVVTVIMLFTNHFVLPRAQKTKVGFENTHIKKQKAVQSIDNLHIFTGPTQIATARSYRLRDSIIRDLVLEEVRDNKLVKYIKSTSARWQGKTGTWLLQNYEIRKINGVDEELILGRGKKLDTLINLYPQDFINSRDEEATLTSGELLNRINMNKKRGMNASKMFEIEFHRRTADPFTVIILTLIGFAISSRKVRGGMGIHLTLGVCTGAIYIFLSRFSQTFAMGSTIPLALGVWIPNIVFGLLALWLIKTAQK